MEVRTDPAGLQPPFELIPIPKSSLFFFFFCKVKKLEGIIHKVSSNSRSHRKLLFALGFASLGFPHKRCALLYLVHPPFRSLFAQGRVGSLIAAFLLFTSLCSLPSGKIRGISPEKIKNNQKYHQKQPKLKPGLPPIIRLLSRIRFLSEFVAICLSGLTCREMTRLIIHTPLYLNV